MGLHGGGYDSRYFDAPGHPADEESARRQPSFAEAAAIIAEAIADAWQQLGDGRPGVVLLGHSIGGAIAVHMAAARTLTWPLLGLTVSGVGDVISPRAPFVDASLWRGGHNIEHHRLGDAYVRAVLVFAERCGSEDIEHMGAVLARLQELAGNEEPDKVRRAQGVPRRSDPRGGTAPATHARVIGRTERALHPAGPAWSARFMDPRAQGA
ncbi:alpha/beta fold hydrolase [Streptomyces plumbiresistens]|uniref:AB hydrolase-1 domain-containing protein n=1 Tax=Streptomyces plumbiresistens TaxID=511811 RepID=A0ABP7RN19_9ACTN